MHVVQGATKNVRVYCSVFDLRNNSFGWNWQKHVAELTLKTYATVV